MKIKKIIPFLLGFFVVTNSCSSSVISAVTKPSSAEVKSITNSELIKANNTFAFKLFKKIGEQESNKNIFFSPASISMVLSMTYNGASGKTKEEIAETLEFKGLSDQKVNQGYDILRRLLLSQDNAVKLNIANSLWLRNDISLKPNFVSLNKEYYNAGVSSLDFKSPQAAATINKWVADNTANKITKLVERIDPATILFLINAIYFKGSWTEKFAKENTSEEKFTLADKTSKNHPLMNLTKEFAYHENDQGQYISLPYGQEKFSMYVLLPAEGQDIKTFANNLDEKNWKEVLGKLKKRKVRLALPKYKQEYAITLNETLKALGMENAFTGSADFSAMVSGKALITEVKHKSYIEVNEEGTEAAAATSVAIGRTSVEIVPKMIVNRPFVYAIADNVSGSILFLGLLNEPKL